MYPIKKQHHDLLNFTKIPEHQNYYYWPENKRYTMPVRIPLPGTAMRKKFFSVLFFLIISISSGWAQDSLTARRIIERLSSQEMRGRSIAYQGDRIAAEYIRDIFREYQISPLQNDYFQTYSFPGHAMEGTVELTIDGTPLNPFDDFRVFPCSKSFTGKEIPIIHANIEILTDAKKREKFILKYKEKLPKSFLYIDATKTKKSPKSSSAPNSLDAEIARLYIARNTQPFNALGFLIGVKEMPVIGLSFTHYERNFAYVQVLASKVSTKSRFLDLSFNNRFQHHRTQNICAKVEGTVYPDSFVVFTAHYDHIGAMGDKVFFPGAHDNASGTATVINLALYFQQNPAPYTTVFCLFSGEEGGLRGSRHFVEHPLLDLEKIKLLINMDMFCGGDDGIMVVNSKDEKTKKFYDRLVEINNDKQWVSEIKSRPNTSNSDHFPFTEKGVPAVFIYTMGGKYGGYHQYTDTNENCSLSQWESIVRLIISWTEQLMQKD